MQTLEHRALNHKDPLLRMRSLGEISKVMRLKDEPMYYEMFLTTASELRHRGLTDDKIFGTFDNGKNS